MASMLVQHVGELPPAIYHYTSAAGLKGIVSDAAIRATDVRFLNDTTEFELGRSTCLAELTARADEGLFGKLCKRVADSFEVSHFQFYAASFSAEDDLVPQWRGYGAHGAGYALGLRTHDLSLLNEHFLIMPVLYKHEEQRAVIHDVIHALEVLWEREIESRRVAKSRVAEVIHLTMLSVLTILSLSLKSELFAYEQEWRLVHVDSDVVADYEPDFREARGMLVPYVAFPLQNPDLRVPSVPIASVTIGPMIRADEAEAGLRRFFAKQQLDVPIRVSKAPLRFL